MRIARSGGQFGKYALKLVRREADVHFVHASSGIGEWLSDIALRVVEEEGFGAEPARGVYGDRYQE